MHAAVAEGPDEDRRLAAHGVHDAGPDGQRALEPEHLLVQVRQRQDREQSLAAPERQDAGHRHGGRHQVAVAEHRPLGLAGGAAREHDLGQRGRGDRGRLDRGRPSRLVEQRLHPHDRQAQLPRDAVRLAAREHKPAIGLGDDLAPELNRMADVQGHRHRTQVRAGQEADAPLRPVDGPDDDPVPLANARCAQDARRARHDPREIAVAPRACAEERPDEQRGLAVEPRCAGLDQVDQRPRIVNLHHAPPPSRLPAAPDQPGEGLPCSAHDGREVPEDDGVDVERRQA